MPSSAFLISIDATSFHFRHCNCFVELGVINQLRLNQNHHCALNFARLLYDISPQATSPTNDYLQGRQLNWIWGHKGLNCCDQTCTVIELEWLFELVNDNCGCLAETASEFGSGNLAKYHAIRDQPNILRVWAFAVIYWVDSQVPSLIYISIYICLIDIRYRYLIQKQIQITTEWGASRLVYIWALQKRLSL